MKTTFAVEVYNGNDKIIGYMFLTYVNLIKFTKT